MKYLTVGETPHTLAEVTVVRALSALAQAQRLRTFRALVIAGPAGLTPGVIAEQLSLAPSALSFHLKELTHAQLVSTEPRGRNVIYRANFPLMQGLMAYLTQHCCEGPAKPATDTPACGPCSPDTLGIIEGTV